MAREWQKLVIKNFDSASHKYDQGAFLQRLFAEKLANQCANRVIQPGLWVDLGSGTGLLANALEEKIPHQSVLRVDGSLQMLSQHPKNKPTKLYNLNCGLPHWKEAPTLIASSFALHWLTKPQERIQEWFSALAPGGWLAIALPVKGSFPEWRNAARQAKVICTAMEFPSHDSLFNAISDTNIQFQKLESFTQEAPKVTSLLKPLVEIGGQASPFPSLTISEWRKLQKSWARSNNTKALRLTWIIQIFLAQK